MPIFASDAYFYTVMQAVFDRLSATPGQIDSFTSSNLVVRLIFTDPTAEVLVDGRQPPLEVFFGPRPGKANLELAMPADLLHRLWLGHESTSAAVFGGKIKITGNVLKAVPLLDLFRAAESVYPTVAAEYQLA
jgi:hypothetical protein